MTGKGRQGGTPAAAAASRATCTGWLQSGRGEREAGERTCRGTYSRSAVGASGGPSARRTIGRMAPPAGTARNKLHLPCGMPPHPSPSSLSPSLCPPPLSSSRHHPPSPRHRAAAPPLLPASSAAACSCAVRAGVCEWRGANPQGEHARVPTHPVVGVPPVLFTRTPRGAIASSAPVSFSFLLSP